MARLAVAVAVVIALAVGVWMLWPDDERGATTTEPLAASTTTISSTTTEPAPTTTEDDHIVDTVEEAEEILREFWLGWFQGLYHRDLARIRPLVASDAIEETARTQFGAIDFQREPTAEAIALSDVELLLSDETCLAVWSSLDVRELTGASTEGVHVFRWINGKWRYASLWAYRNDVWQDDCR
jgi:hypothetical protein